MDEDLRMDDPELLQKLAPYFDRIERSVHAYARWRGAGAGAWPGDFYPARKAWQTISAYIWPLDGETCQDKADLDKC